MRLSGSIRFILISVVLSFCCSLLFAQGQQETVVFALRPQPGVEKIRYQIDGEIEGEWLELDPSYSIRIQNFNPIMNLLYIQKNTEGSSWSASEIYQFDMAKNDWTQVVFIKDAEESLGASGPVLEIGAFAGVRLDNSLFTSFFTSEPYALRTRILPAVSADVIFENVSELGPASVLSLGVGLGFQGHMTQASPVGDVYFIDAHFIPRIDFLLDERTTLSLGVGPTVAYVPGWDLINDTVPFTYSASNKTVLVGATSQLSFQYALDKKLSLGLQGEVRILYTTAFDPYDLTLLAKALIAFNL
jgi:hypothetical protein